MTKSDFNSIFGEIKGRSNNSTPTFTIIYGNVGCGKTVLATTAQELGKCVLINFENRISHIDETENLRIVPTSKTEYRQDVACSYQQFMNFFNCIKTNEIKFDYLIIDTLDEMFVKFLQGMLENGEIADKYYGRAEVYNKIWNITKQIKDMGINIIATCHQKQEVNTDLLLADKFKSKINMNVDNVFYLDNDRILHLKANQMIITKLTAKPEIYNSIPSEIEKPTWRAINETFRKG